MSNLMRFREAHEDQRPLGIEACRIIEEWLEQKIMQSIMTPREWNYDNMSEGTDWLKAYDIMSWEAWTERWKNWAALDLLKQKPEASSNSLIFWKSVVEIFYFIKNLRDDIIQQEQYVDFIWSNGIWFHLKSNATTIGHVNETARFLKELAERANGVNRKLDFLVQVATSYAVFNRVDFNSPMVLNGYPLMMREMFDNAKWLLSTSKCIIGSLIAIDLHQFILESCTPDHVNSLENKKRWLATVNNALRPHDLAILNNVTNEPALLVINSSRDGLGRFALQDRVTKKRTGSFQYLTELMPLRLVPDIPRKEGAVERRNKKATDEGDTPKP